jgi:hypothetical protein
VRGGIVDLRAVLREERLLAHRVLWNFLAFNEHRISFRISPSAKRNQSLSSIFAPRSLLGNSPLGSDWEAVLQAPALRNCLLLSTTRSWMFSWPTKTWLRRFWLFYCARHNCELNIKAFQ